MQRQIAVSEHLLLFVFVRQHLPLSAISNPFSAGTAFYVRI